MKVNKNQKYLADLEKAGHKLIRYEDSIDIWRLSVDHHNGPECELCGKKWCYHCRSAIEPCSGKAA